LRRLYEDDDSSKVRQDQLERLQVVLSYLDAAVKPGDLSVPGFRLHRLKGELRDFWSVSVSGNWRVIFRFEDGDAYDVDWWTTIR
jgi:proteic killer suppression protein